MSEEHLSSQVRLNIQLNTGNWEQVVSVYANHINIHSDLSPETVTLTFMQVFPPPGNPAELEESETPIVLSSPVVSRVTVSRSKFKSFIDQIQDNYGMWFEEPDDDTAAIE